MGESHASGMAYSSAAPIPLYKEQGQQQKSQPDRSGSGQERRPPPKSNTKGFHAFERMRPGEELGGLTPSHWV